MVNIKQSNPPLSVQIKSNNDYINVSPKLDSSLIYNSIAKEWACKMNGPVDNDDYSAKHYANIANNILMDPNVKIIANDISKENNIKTCAENILEIKNAKNNAQISQEQAEIAKEKVETIINISNTKANTNLDNLTETGIKIIKKNSNSGLPIGTIFSHTASNNFVPENSLACDGAEYTKTQFPHLYIDWLANGNLLTCTYNEYEQEVSNTGECIKFGIDTVQGKFKVPTKTNKLIAVNKSIPVKGDGKTLGLDDGLSKAGFMGGTPRDVPTFVKFNNAYGVPKGTKITSGSSSINPSYTVGITEDSSKSGIVTDSQNTTYKEIRYFVVVATGSIKQSEMDWSAWASSLQSKANMDGGNFSQIGKELLSGFSMPSDRYIDLTLGTSGTSYTAPANGYYILNKTTNGSNQNVQLQNVTASLFISTYAPASGSTIKCYIPAKKGNEVKAFYSAGGVLQYFRFIYAEGSK